MKKKLLLNLTTLMLVTATMMAVPVKPGVKKMVTLKDGSTVELTLKGDEHYSYYTDAEGKAYQLQNGELVTLTNEEVTKRWTAMKQQRLNINGASTRRTHRIVGEPRVTIGNQRGLVILLQYQDVKFQNDSATTNNIYKRFFNEEGYHEYGMIGSVRDYFIKQSYGKLTIDFDVVGPYTISQEMAYYGAQYIDEKGNLQVDTNPALMVREGVDAAEEDGVDFSKYDWDGNGEVDQVFVVYAGFAQAQGAAVETIWPHESVLARQGVEVRYDGVLIQTYGCSSELRGTSGSEIDGIGTACHEFSHCLGLPDMYDTSGGDNYGMNYWDIMDGGSYNDGSRTPAGFTAYERWFSGWMEPVELKELTTVMGMKPLATYPEAYVLYNEAMPQNIKGEYYILENRQAVDFDSQLPGHGMLIYHVDYDANAWRHNMINATEGHQRMVIVPANNIYEEKGGYLYKVEGNVWPGISGNTMLGNYTRPAATLYNPNIDGTMYLNKLINGITEDREAKTISFVACRPEMSVPDIENTTEQVDGDAVTISWPAVSGAVKYELRFTSKDKAPDTPQEAFIEEYNFTEFESETISATPINGNLKNYGMENWGSANLYTTPNKLRIGSPESPGILASPWKLAPSSTHATLVIGTDIVDREVHGIIRLLNGDGEGDNITNWMHVGSIDFKVTGNQRIVINLHDMDWSLYRFNIEPESQMYLNYLAIYDGVWTADQLGINNTEQVSHRAAATNIYEATTNSLTFTRLSKNKIYSYQLRSFDEEGNFSGWSEEKTFDLEALGIQNISTKSESDNSVHYFNLQGHEVSPATKGLLIRKQGNEVKKVVKQ
jgi:M6 family metalloprotease-like protein